ncbi:hypothetical protein BDR26DRAFT_405352 [Obelidium mucronatum]|nr:hypothetical protein BDR26DRAFT_405352 [Obelidium mucronatum]
MTNYSEELAELKKLRADVSGRGSKSASATPKSTSASATPSKLRIETTSFSVVGDDDDEVASLLVVPPPRSKTPQRRSESNSSIKTTPSARTAPNSAKINYVHHRATELDNLLIHGDVAPAAEEKTVSEAGGMTPTAVTPAKKIARGGFRSNAATPASAKNKRRRDLVDEEGDETSTSVATSAVKRNPFIGRQSMINRQDDAGTSKKYLAATKWLEETKLFVLQKLAEKAQIAAAQLTGDSIDGAVE